jgi:hypothetical protein
MLSAGYKIMNKIDKVIDLVKGERDTPPNSQP